MRNTKISRKHVDLTTRGASNTRRRRVNLHPLTNQDSQGPCFKKHMIRVTQTTVKGHSGLTSISYVAHNKNHKSDRSTHGRQEQD